MGADPNPFRYCGEYFDVESGAYYLRARYYGPSIGRFTQEDTPFPERWRIGLTMSETDSSQSE
ncbi:MAG: hypothetical protein IIZ68_04970 [Clostridia bacterium]|nr:hypothetical protein [Clostridia bacterium]